MWGSARKARMAITTLSVRRRKVCGGRLINKSHRREG